MVHDSNKKFENLISNCKSELLNHTLQSEVASPHIKNINSYLDECLNILQKNSQENPEIKRSRAAKVNADVKSKILFFAYCMSKWDYLFTNTLTGNTFNQSEAFEYLADKLKTKVGTLRNYRDEFDSHVKQNRSNRQGWKKPLNLEFRAIIQQYNSYSEANLIKIGKNILRDIS